MTQNVNHYVNVYIMFLVRKKLVKCIYLQIDDDNQQLYFPQAHVKDTEVTR